LVPTGVGEGTLRADTASFRYFTEGAFDPIAVVAGLIQTAIYADFGYIVSSGLSCPPLLLVPLASLSAGQEEDFARRVSVFSEPKRTDADEVSS
jgi:hypothetical protein